MDKINNNNKIEELEAALKQLKKLANEPEQRTLECGDVFTRGDEVCLATQDESCVVLTLRGETEAYRSPCSTAQQEFVECLGAYLGKFTDVYVKISDVRDALSHKDSLGDSVLVSESGESSIFPTAIIHTRKALRKLNIIK